jgi:class 3 adenylate cyclase
MTDSSSGREMLVMFADIGGSTSIYEQLGDAAAVELIQELLARMEEEAYFHRGAVIKTIGDELLCTFPDPVSGLAAATAMQQQAASMSGPGGRKLALRIGMHYGPALEDRGDLFGDAVNVAARVVELAQSGQTLITDACFERVPLLGRSRIRTIDRMSVRGRSAETTIMEVMWQHGRAVTTVVPPVPRSHVDEGCVILHHAGRAYTIAPQGNPFLIGRDASCQLCVTMTMASRQHAAVEWRRGKFVLTDRSTNGTFVVPEGGRPIHLRREEFVLQGNGLIGLGEQPRVESGAVVGYEFRPGTLRS